MAKLWFLRSEDGERRGPFSSQQLKQLANSGKLQPTDAVRPDGSIRWVQAKAIKGLFTAKDADRTSHEHPRIECLGNVTILEPHVTSLRDSGQTSFRSRIISTRADVSRSARQQNKAILLSVGVTCCLALSVMIGLMSLRSPDELEQTQTRSAASTKGDAPVLLEAQFDPNSFARTQHWAATITRIPEAPIEADNPIVGNEQYQERIRVATQKMHEDSRGYIGTPVHWRFVITRIFYDGEIEFTSDYEGLAEFYFEADISKESASLPIDVARHLHVGDPVIFSGTIDQVYLENNSRWGWDEPTVDWDVCIVLKECAVHPVKGSPRP